MKFLNALEEAHRHIKTLWCALVIAAAVNMVTLAGWMHSESKLQIDVPPEIPQSGLTLTQGEVPKTTIYSFAFYVWQSVNHWSANGLTDYKQQITNFSPFITAEFKNSLVRNYNNLLNDGELQDRLRMLEDVEGQSYSNDSVKYLGNGEWLVHLNMRLLELMNTNAKIVKDVEMGYDLKIVRYNIDAKNNPWGLAIAGFSGDPVRVKTIV